MSTPTRITHLIGGQSWTGTAERTSPVFNPATGEQTRVLYPATTELVGEVVASAKAAWEGWAETSLAKRAHVLFAFRQLLDERKNEMGVLITAEHGKVLSDAVGEVTRGLEVAEFACGIPHLMKGGLTENASTNVDVYSIRQPLGVVAVISPFNFPAMVPMWFIPIAIACGNAVVLKPSEKDPSAAIAIAALWKEAGLPDGITNVVNGDKEAVDALLAHPDVKAVSFVGSTPIAQYVYETGTSNGKRVQALGGAKNHMLVLPDADLDLAADAAVNAGFISAGERCMAISALVAVAPIADEIFGPVLSVLRVDSYDEGLEMINANPYGNGTAIFTNDGGAARRFQREVEVGMVGVNVPIPRRSRTTPSAAGRTHCSVTPTPTAWRACTSSPGARSSRRAGSTRATAASTSAFRRTPDLRAVRACRVELHCSRP